MIQKGRGLADLFKNITRPLAPVLNPVFKEVETITRPLKPILNSVLKEAKGIGTAVGVNLADGLLQDLISGKSSKASAKARGQQAGLNAKNMATARVLQALGQNGNGFPGGDPLIALDSDVEENITKSKPSTKRKRTQSTSKPPAKRKRAEPKSQPPKRKRPQKGGAILPTKRNQPQTGGFGGLFSGLYRGMEKLEKKASKRVLKHIDRKKRKSKKRKSKKRTQTGGIGGGIEMGNIFRSMYRDFDHNRKLVKKHFGRKKSKKQAGKKARKQKGKEKKKRTLGSVIRGAYKELWP